MPELWSDGDIVDVELNRRCEYDIFKESIIFWGVAISSITFIIVISIMAVT